MFTQEEIAAMAKEIGMPVSDTFGPMVGACPVGDLLERFAALVADKAAARERERFALECIDLVAFHGGSVEIEAAIRARGQKEGA